MPSLLTITVATTEGDLVRIDEKKAEKWDRVRGLTPVLQNGFMSGSVRFSMYLYCSRCYECY